MLLVISCLSTIPKVSDILYLRTICVVNPPIYSTDILANEGKYQFDDSYKVYLLNKKYGDLKIECEEENDYCMVHARFKKAGKTEMILEL